MKRLAIICAAFLLLMGCSKKADVKPILKNISFNTDITYYNEKYTAKGNVDDFGMFTLEIVEPSELTGMTFTVDDGDIKVEYKGLSFSPNENSLSMTAIGMLHSGFSAVKQKNADYEYGDKNYTVSAKNNNGEFLMSYSPAGLPIEIKCLSDAFKAEFYDMKLLKNE